MNWRLALGLVLALLLATFNVQNYQVVEIRFLFWKVEMSRAFVILGVFAGGLAAGWLLPRMRRISRG